jgi:hypothetical protein
VIPFNGKRNKWAPWEEKYLARAKHKGIKPILLGQKIIPKASEILVAETKMICLIMITSRSENQTS